MTIHRSLFLFPLITILLQGASSPGSEAAKGIVTANREPLQPNAFNPLPLGAVVPKGWLRKQLEIQAAGLTGHLDEIWNDVGSNSGWLGGSGESWERGPYFLDGLLPLAYQLDDERLKEKAQRWVDWTLTHQQDTGQIGPAGNDDWWPRMVMLKVLTQYAEASGDTRVIPLMTKYFKFELRELPNRPLRDWGKYRWQDNVYSVLWLYNRTGQEHLLTLAKLLHDQGYDWEAQFADFRYKEKQTTEGLGLKPHTPIPEPAMQTHGVNNAMALKVAPVWWLVSKREEDRAALTRQLEMLDRYHGLPNGMFSGDEHFAGTDPSQGIELCAVVESMFSYEEDFAILGDPRLADRLERITFNALPATLSDDMWSHQYDQQPNQISCTRAHRQWSTNNDDSNMFGLEPNFGCCTANLHQGWPKFVSNLWMATPDEGLVTVAYAPSRVHTTIHGKPVEVDEDTTYPFHGEVRFTLHLKQPDTFPLVFRVPGWAKRASVSVNGKLFASASSSESLPKFSREWKNGDVVTVSFDMTPRVSRWYHDSAVFERGPLVFALPLGEQWSEVKRYAQKSGDWEIRPSQAWNYAVQVGDCDATATEHSVPATPFDVKHPAVTLTVQGRPVPEWSIQENSAGAVPQGPVSSQKPVQPLTLVPYGAAKLRVTAFPALKEASHCPSAAAGSHGY